MSISTILLINFAAITVLMVALWRYSIRIKDVSFIDAFWAFGMVMLAGLTFALSDGHPARKLLLLGLTALWGLRLGLHLLARWRASGVDPRYAAILGRAMKKKGWSFSRASLQMAFGMQAPLLFIVCLPAQLGQIAVAPPIGVFGITGAVIALFGIGFETIGDAQLARHRRDPAMTGKVLDTGLWRYTRHPNYFGDACTWWGIWLVAAETGPGLFAIIGPILLTVLLTRVSGVPMLERALKTTRPGYENYLRRTSAFFPLPPKKSPK